MQSRDCLDPTPRDSINLASITEVLVVELSFRFGFKFERALLGAIINLVVSLYGSVSADAPESTTCLTLTEKYNYRTACVEKYFSNSTTYRAVF
jgi:hypothetical protein